MASSDADQRFIPYEKMAQRLSQWHSQKLDSIKKWVALEKIHGANFSFTVTCRAQETQLEPIGTESLATVMVARRGDYLKDGEYFFGVLTQREFIELEKEKARHVCAMVRQRIDSDAHLTESVTIFGELFGGENYVKLLLVRH